MPSFSAASALTRSKYAVPFALLAFFPLSAEAVSQQIHAVFKPDPGNPQFNEFENRTPTSGFCLDNPPQCADQKLFSLRLPIQSVSNATIEAGHDNPRRGAMFNIPSQWQPITVTHPTAPPQTVMFRVAGMGVAYRLPKPAPELTDGAGHNYLWQGGIWSYASPPCVGLAGAGNDIGFNSFWRHPVNTGICSKRAMYDIPQPFKYETFDITYELNTPNPLQMDAGEYTGQHVLHIGPGQDFDLGDVMVANDNVIVLDFKLDVEHVLKVDIPPGGERIQLTPSGGWQSWLQTGRRPARLLRDQHFNISASSRFKMHLECEFSTVIYDCMLDDRVSRREVELRVGVSLPNGLTDLEGQPVRHARLRTGAARALHFQPGFYVDRGPGMLHFEVPQEQMAFMLEPGAGPFYRGRVTVIWDSEV